MACPCGLPQPLEACCGPFLSGEANPTTAEQLMRSRYTAFTLEEVDYILDTHHPKTRKQAKREEIERWARDSQWLGLTIKETADGGPDDDEGRVEFVARYRAGGSEVSHHEHAEFVRVNGEWRYLDGKVMGPRPVVREAPKIGRNDPCPCGSGRKYKKCCGRS